MFEYKIEDLRGKYVKAGTPECEVFLDACEKLGLKWISGKCAKSGKSRHEIISIYAGEIGGSDEAWHKNKGYTPFTPKPQWSPETNTLPMKDLSVEQRGYMKHIHRDGGRVKFQSGISGLFEDITGEVLWSDALVYRVTPPSPRDRFSSEAIDHLKSAGFDVRYDDLLVGMGIVFDAIKNGEIKAPDVEK